MAGVRFFAAIVLFVAGLAWMAGCRPSLTVSEEATAWNPLERDPLETGDHLDRWPGWRGVNSAGIAPGGKPAITFGPENGVRWKVSVPGEGSSSPVIWGRFLFLTTELVDVEPHQLAILCFDRHEGKLLWQTPLGEPVGRTHEKNGYASASVAVDGERVYACFGSTGLFCCDFSGKRLWRAELGDLDQIWGSASSPILYENMVIQLCDSPKTRFLGAFDRLDGRPIWRAERPSEQCWTTPVVVQAETPQGRRTELIVNGACLESGDGQITAYDPHNGHELWHARGTTNLVTPTALVSGDRVFSMSGRNGSIFSVRAGGSGDVTDRRVVWKTKNGGPYIPSGVLYRNRLYVLFDNGMLSCYNPGNGERIWRGRLKGDFTASLIAADGRLYACDERGTVYVAAAGDSFELLAANSFGERVYSTLAVADGDLFLRTRNHLYCIAGEMPEKQPVVEATKRAAETVAAEAAAAETWPMFRGNSAGTGVARGSLPDDLELLWTFSVPNDGFDASAVIGESAVFTGTLDGAFFAIDLTGGKKIWEVPGKIGYNAAPALAGDLVVAGDFDGRIQAFDQKAGKRKWYFDANAEINSGVNVVGDRILFSSQDMFLYCLDAATGRLVWKYETDDQLRCMPTVSDGCAFAAGCDNHLHVVDMKDGKLIRKVDVGTYTGCTPALVGNMAFIGTESRDLFGIDWRAGKIVWTYTNDHRNDQPFRASPAAAEDIVVIGSQDKRVHAVDPKTGNRRWIFSTGGHVDSSPVIVGKRVFVGSNDGVVYALDRATGEKVWQYKGGGRFMASPAVANGRLVIGNSAGDLFCFGKK